MLKTAVPHMSANEAIALILDAAATVENNLVADGVALALGAILSSDEIDAFTVVSQVRATAAAEREARERANLVAGAAESAVEALDEAIQDAAMECYPLGLRDEDEPVYSAFVDDVYDAVKALLTATPEGN